jgi:hypothetical protein
MADEQHKHEWVPIREGYPQKICKCGVLRALGFKSGNNTITINPSPATQEVIRWTSFHSPTVGDLAMASVGRPSFAVGSATASDIQYACGYGESTSALFTRWQANPALTTISGVGTGTAFTAEGTAATTATATYGHGIQYTTAAALNSDGGWLAGAFTDARGEAQFNAVFVVRTGATITNVRYWIGLFSGDPMGSATPAVSLAAWRYDTATDGTVFWRCCTGTGGAPQVTTTTLPVSASTNYVFRISSNGSGTYKFFNGATGYASHSTTVPAGTTNMGPVSEVRTLDAVAKVIVNYRIILGQTSVAS